MTIEKKRGKEEDPSLLLAQAKKKKRGRPAVSHPQKQEGCTKRL